MIPCHICGIDASTGWTKGFVPAPDSQKMALCAQHDTEENRRLVAAAWLARQEKAVATLTTVARQKSSPGIQLATVHFTGGGMLSFTCTRCAPTQQGTLLIEQPDGTHTFIPMQHVREYTIRPYLTAVNGDAPKELPGSGG